ncbi:MAG: hypothetical protein KJO07_12675 [Deltaproteobacteria bacterium]|nr:hypothetical protein [Deltaproteobacteria bacterium]
MAIQEDKRCSLSAVDGSTRASVTAFLNPKEFQVDKTVPWSKKTNHHQDAPALEFTHAEPKNLAVELLFDTYESGESLEAKYIAPIEAMSSIDSALGRPPKVLFTWGTFKFHGAIESVSVKYTMFKDNGTACRAVVNIKMKEAERLQAGGQNGGGSGPSEGESMRNNGPRDSNVSDDTIHQPGPPGAS